MHLQSRLATEVHYKTHEGNTAGSMRLDGSVEWE
jgi:hypothetical protein